MLLKIYMRDTQDILLNRKKKKSVLTNQWGKVSQKDWKNTHNNGYFF